MDYAKRVRRLRERLAQERVRGLVVSHLPNVRYLTGFSGSNGLLWVSPNAVRLWTDSRYREQVASEVAGVGVSIPPQGTLWEALGQHLRRHTARRAGTRIARVAVESDHITLAEWERLRASVPGLQPSRSWVEELRAIKEPEEIAAIRAAVELGSSVFEAALEKIRPGMRETEVAGLIEFGLRQAGGEGVAFETLVASGRRGARVHARASSKPVENKDFVILDYGVKLAGYMSDMTRTVCVGRPSQLGRDRYRAVLDAQLAAIAAVRPGVAAAKVDLAARRVLQQAGLGPSFVHSTGHGLGLEVHESPRVASRSADRLAAGNVITIEPGIYLPAWGGVRIEDVIVVTEQGAEVMTPTSKRLLSV
ncbi:MAG: M24 family metallopeptidase [Terriglobales bacterium]